MPWVKKRGRARKNLGATVQEEVNRTHNYDLSLYTPIKLKHGFHTGLRSLPDFSIECKNLLSAISQPECVNSLIDTEIQKGYLCGPFDNIPYKHFRINPIGVAEGKFSKKKRLIVDLSAPHDDELIIV